jgi:signal transduction histidine kinase
LVGTFSGIPFIRGWAQAPRRIREAQARLEKAREAEQAAIRRLRLASHDLRTIGLHLQGIGDDMAWIGPPYATDITAVAANVFDMADDLHEFTIQADTAHVLNDEQFNLAIVLDGALSDVATAIRPGRREWRIGPSVSPTPIRADRRALRYVLTRLLTVVVRGTSQDSVIDISMVPREDGLALVIEPAGEPAPDQSAPPPPAEDAGAISARLALAHTLIQAHGGRLELEPRPGLGMRATMILPRARLAEAAR